MRTKYVYISTFAAIFMAVILLSVIQVKGKEPQQISSYWVVIDTSPVDKTWFYEIYKDSTLIIKQNKIPAVKGNQNLSSRDDAEKLASLVISKLEEGRVPSVKYSELEELNIIFKK